MNAGSGNLALKKNHWHCYQPEIYKCQVTGGHEHHTKYRLTDYCLVGCLQK